MIALAATALLLAVFNIYVRSTLMTPLEHDLAGLSFIEEVTVESRPQKSVVIAMGEVPHLREAYLQVEPIVAARFNNQPVPIIIKDRRNERLVDAFYKLRPLILEAAVTGNMAGRTQDFQSLAKELGLTTPTSFTVDGRYIYVQVHDAGGNYMYVIEPQLARSEIAGGGWQQ